MKAMRGAVDRLRMTSWQVLAVLGTAMAVAAAGYWATVAL